MWNLQKSVSDNSHISIRWLLAIPNCGGSTLLDSGYDFEAPGAFYSVCSCVVFTKTLMLVQLLKEKVAALYI